jgi:hypothetical protein
LNRSKKADQATKAAKENGKVRRGFFGRKKVAKKDLTVDPVGDDKQVEMLANLSPKSIEPPAEKMDDSSVDTTEMRSQMEAPKEKTSHDGEGENKEPEGEMSTVADSADAERDQPEEASPAAQAPSTPAGTGLLCGCI